MSSIKKAVPGALAVFYLAIALEVIIMISPFAAYFYSLYAPLLGIMDAVPYTRWLVGFFLPHIALTGDPFLTALNFLGPLLLVLGTAAFLVCAAQVYGKKILGKGVAVGGLYRFVRHPQYLGLAIAGLGLLLFWPRFIILVLYVTMLSLYYLLAKNEEQRMERKFGATYREYAQRVPMFLPGDPGGRLFRAVTGRSKASAAGAAGVYLAGLVLGTLVGFGLRAYTTSQVTTIENGRFVAVALTPIPKERLKSIVETAVGDPAVRS
ncbi:MAG: methyltransferase family protein, partial [Dehalococcoidia bacterium]